MKIEYQAIGVIHSPFKDVEGMPIQPAGANGVRGRVEVSSDYAEGLKDLEGFSHIILVYHFHRVAGTKLRVMPFLDSEPRGIFATRAPKRPNPIGLSVAKLVGIEGHEMHIENVDILDGTPLLDIKPYVPKFDEYPADRIGWLEKANGKVKGKRADSRFRCIQCQAAP